MLRLTIPRPTSPCRADEAVAVEPETVEAMTDEAAVEPETAPDDPDTAESVLAEAEDDTGTHPAIPQAPEDEPEPQQKRRFGLFRRKQRADEPDPETPDADTQDPWEL